MRAVVVGLNGGVVAIQGFQTCSVSELFVIQQLGLSHTASQSFGIVVNLTRDDSLNLVVSGLLVNPAVRISTGSFVKGSGRMGCVLLGDHVIGSILDALGGYSFVKGRIDAKLVWLIESAAPSIISRESVYEPLQTGIISIDALIPIGRGQRELVVGDRGIGKTSIGLDTILNQRYEKVLCNYLPIGQKASSILEILLTLIRRDAVFYLAILYASATASALSQFISAYTGTALAEFFMYLRELPVFIMLDDLSKHGVAYREIYLLLGRPPGREGYPGEIFFVHSRLLERSAKLAPTLGGGSITAFPVVETLASDVSAYITTNVISITDGQIFLSQDLFLSGVKPAVDQGLSVSRVGSVAQCAELKLVGSSYKLELAQYAELQSFAGFSSDLGADTMKRLERGMRLIELIKQDSGSPLSTREQVNMLSLASQGKLDKVPVAEIKAIF
jgi:F-type H+-transporting ATPase subunit alpha